MKRLFFLVFVYLLNSVIACEPTKPICPSQPIESYQIMDLGTLESAISEATWINNKGEVVGQYILDKKLYTYIWSKENGLKVIDLPEDANIVKINNKGQILGELDYCGFVYDPQEGLIKIKNRRNITVYDINDAGQVVGSFFRDGRFIAFLWSKDQWLELPHIYDDLGLPAENTEALAINDEGNIVGFSSRNIVHKGEIVSTKKCAVIWKAANHWQIEEIFPESLEISSAIAINNSNKIVCEKEFGWEMYDLNYQTFKKMSDFVLDFRSFNDAERFLFLNFIAIQLKEELNAYSAYATSIEQEDTIPNLHEGIWRRVLYLTSINSHGYVTGVAETVFGENHAVLFVPINKK